MLARPALCTLIAALVLPILERRPDRGRAPGFFAATGEFFGHSDFRSPRWIRYFIQTPDPHSIHREHDVHRYSVSDLPVRHRQRATCRDSDTFAARRGFPRHNERKLGAMLAFRDAYDD